MREGIAEGSRGKRFVVEGFVQEAKVVEGFVEGIGERIVFHCVTRCTCAHQDHGSSLEIVERVRWLQSKACRESARECDCEEMRNTICERQVQGLGHLDLSAADLHHAVICQ